LLMMVFPRMLEMRLGAIPCSGQAQDNDSVVGHSSTDLQFSTESTNATMEERVDESKVLVDSLAVPVHPASLASPLLISPPYGTVGE